MPLHESIVGDATLTCFGELGYAIGLGSQFAPGEPAAERDLFGKVVRVRALQRKVMTMRDWIKKLDEFLKLSEHELLDHAGKISAEQAKMKAELEYERYRVFLDSQPRAVDLDFEQAASKLKQMPKPKNPKAPKS